MGVSPVFDEQHLIRLLNPAVDIPLETLENLFGFTIMACFDRRVERDFMADVVLSCLGGVRAARGMVAEARVLTACEAPQDDAIKTKVEHMVNASALELQAIRNGLFTKMGLLSQCPTAADPVS